MLVVHKVETKGFTAAAVCYSSLHHTIATLQGTCSGGKRCLFCEGHTTLRQRAFKWLAYLCKHFGCPTQLAGFKPQKVNQLHEVSNVLGSEVVLPQKLSPATGLVLSVTKMVVQLYVCLLSCFACYISQQNLSSGPSAGHVRHAACSWKQHP